MVGLHKTLYYTIILSHGHANTIKTFLDFKRVGLLGIFHIHQFLFSDLQIASLKILYMKCSLCPQSISQSKCPFPSWNNSHSSMLGFLQVNIASLYLQVNFGIFHFMVHQDLICDPVTEAFPGQCFPGHVSNNQDQLELVRDFCFCVMSKMFTS